ncbi:hypothetical protein AB0A05_27165 [Streptomyces sp. NPDC046374]|uniref:hypothetical protein n=1 Tax=Streptomyces sp. NPDC046374 TaxID=3154917 RepID=UPI0033D4D9B5
MDTTYNPNPDWDGPQWLMETRAVRSALKAIGVEVPECLAGEPKDCGEPTWSHYAAYCSMLKMRAQFMLDMNLGDQPGPPGTGIPDLAEHYGEHVYRATLTNETRRWTS